jgi:hypothetical protein
MMTMVLRLLIAGTLLTLTVLMPSYAQKAPAPGALATAVATGDINAVEDILGMGGSADQPDSLGQTPLMYAVLSGEYHLVERLLQTKADPDRPGRENLTPLIAAVRASREDLVLLLISNDADPNSITDISGVPTSALSAAVNRGENRHRQTADIPRREIRASFRLGENGPGSSQAAQGERAPGFPNMAGHGSFGRSL